MKYLLLIPLLLLFGCTSPTSELHPDASDVEIRMDSGFDASQCTWLGEAFGNEGHWYSYLLYPNDTLTQGAINQLKNEAKALGANTVFVGWNNDFTTSVTLFGSAYHCEGRALNR